MYRMESTTLFDLSQRPTTQPQSVIHFNGLIAGSPTLMTEQDRIKILCGMGAHEFIVAHRTKSGRS